MGTKRLLALMRPIEQCFRSLQRKAGSSSFILESDSGQGPNTDYFWLSGLKDSLNPFFSVPSLLPCHYCHPLQGNK